jgi:hypothetical protein
MSETTHSDATVSVLKAAIILCRLLQVAGVLLSVIFVAGALAGGMGVLAFLFIAIVVALLLLAVLVLEFVAVRGLRGWADEE